MTIAPLAANLQSYGPEDHYLGDVWFFRTPDQTVHLFHLQSTRRVSPDERHHCSSIGHAVTKDYAAYTARPTALRPGKEGSWDDLALWTGCVYSDGRRYLLFYTGRSKKEFWIQRIGAAVTQDPFLNSWEKLPGPLLQADPTWYEMGDRQTAAGGPLAWRDPYVFREDGQEYLMALAANDIRLPGPYNGCVALARATDLGSWTALPPLFSPGRYAEMEVPQIISYGGYYYLFFSTWAKYSPAWHEQWPGIKQGGLHCYSSRRLRGPYRPAVGGHGLVLDNAMETYALNCAEIKGNRARFIGFLNNDVNNNFVGKISRPVTIALDRGMVYPEAD